MRATLLMTMFWLSACAHQRSPVPGRAPSAGDPTLAACLEQARVELQLPGAGALRLDGDGIAEAIVGFRSLRTLEPLELGDPFHLGSTTKPMTATLAAVLVEAGLLHWDTPLQAVFPELTIHAAYADVPLHALATHYAGMPRDPSLEDLEMLKRVGTPAAQRMELVRRVLRRAPDHPRTEWGYSNVGYILLGAAIERASATGFETTMRERLFQPLGMTSCGFFAPSSSAHPGGVPVGHDRHGVPVSEGAAGDLPPIYLPAGLVHCNLRDFTKFAEEHVRGERGEGMLLPRAAYERLHAPVPASSYAYGWAVARSSSGVVLSHAGGNNAWHAMIIIHVATAQVTVLGVNTGTVDQRDLERLIRRIDAGKCGR